MSHRAMTTCRHRHPATPRRRATPAEAAAARRHPKQYRRLLSKSALCSRRQRPCATASFVDRCTMKSVSSTTSRFTVISRRVAPTRRVWTSGRRCTNPRPTCRSFICARATYLSPPWLRAFKSTSRRQFFRLPAAIPRTSAAVSSCAPSATFGVNRKVRLASQPATAKRSFRISSRTSSPSSSVTMAQT